jgi:hypothetical protein
MVEKTFCDRCDKEIISPIKKDPFEDFFDVKFDKNLNYEVNYNVKNAKVKYPDGSSKELTVPVRLIKLQLCEDCTIEYNKIVRKANQEILNWVKKK